MRAEAPRTVARFASSEAARGMLEHAREHLGLGEIIATVAAIVDEMLTNSDNNTAEMLVKEIGLGASVADGAIGTRQAGLDIMTGTELTFAAPCLDFEVYSGVLGLSESRPLSLLLDIVLMFTAVHLVIAHVLLCEGLLEKHRFIVTELQTNSIF